jgi:signal recognition particle subunit SRP68
VRISITRERGNELMGRCYYLARLHCIHPTPSYASAVQLLERASRLISTAKSSLFELGIPLEENITELSRQDVTELAKRIDALSLASKRALFAERVPKPVFFDTAFNYIDIPMDDLLVLAGKQEAKPKAAAAPVVQKVAQVADKIVPGTSETVKGAVNAAKRATREATPAVDESGGGEEGKPKGWLGGWFGRK